MVAAVAALHRASVTHVKRRPLPAAITLSATPRLPEEDSTSTESSRRRRLRSAAATIEAAARTLIEPPRFRPSHFIWSACPR